ncbi:MAG: CAP domain-containing protein [Thermoanaerobaculia bacterium]|nr:CAP domain-containing protein [Thermoanaerobaculia bacterium]
MSLQARNVRQRSGAAVIVALLLAVGAPATGAEIPVRDSPQLAATIKAMMLATINEQRHAFGLPPLRLDPLASSVGDALCRRQVYDRSVGHISTDGLSPFHRYSFAGGLDGITENTAAWSKDTPYTETEIEGLVAESMRAMLAEAPPRDGHRRAILDPRATHVGLGFAWRGGEVRVAHEFVRRYLRWTVPPPREIRPGEKATCAARPVRGWEIAAISVHFEPMPKPLSRTRASAIESYELPSTRSDFAPRRAGPGSEIARIARAGTAGGELTVAPDGSFTFAIPFAHGPGVYTLVAWVSNGEEKVPASNVSIRVIP